MNKNKETNITINRIKNMYRFLQVQKKQVDI